jgi:hypothetical protein
MNIEKLSGNLAPNRMTKLSAVNQAVNKEGRIKLGKKDSVDTSDLSQLISTNLPELNAANAVRADKIRQFASMADSVPAIPDDAIKVIFRRLATM